MSQSSNTLIVSTGPLAEISVLDGSMNTVAQSVGGLTKELTPGLYKIRVRNGPSVEEELVSLDKDRSVEIQTPPIFSPIPLVGTTRSHDYHMQRAVAASRDPQVTLGEGSGLFVFCREWSATSSGTAENPASGLSIADERGEELVDLGKKSVVDTMSDPSSAWCATAAPGAYRLRLALPGGGVTERALFASPGCQTQIFILLTHTKSADGAPPAPDIAGGAVIISPSFSFDPQDRRTQLGEIARYALAQKRRVVTDELRREIVDEKFDDPMLGLLGAHLILQDEPENVDLFDVVTGNLLRLLGPDHPDLRALCLRRREPLLQVPRALETPPMLRASWDIAVAASLEDSTSFLETGRVTEIADKIVPTGSWLLWRRDPVIKSAAGSSAGSSSALAQSLEEYLAARARLEATRRANDQSVLGHLSSAFFDLLSSALNRVRGKSNQPKPTMPSLDADDRAELSRVLGIPGPLLDNILRKIFD